MNKEELEIIKKAIRLGNGYLDSYCEFMDEYVLSEEEINRIEDTEEKDRAIELKNDSDTFLKALEIIEKL